LRKLLVLTKYCVKFQGKAPDKIFSQPKELTDGTGNALIIKTSRKSTVILREIRLGFPNSFSDVRVAIGIEMLIGTVLFLL